MSQAWAPQIYMLDAKPRLQILIHLWTMWQKDCFEACFILHIGLHINLNIIRLVLELYLCENVFHVSVYIGYILNASLWPCISISPRTRLCECVVVVLQCNYDNTRSLRREDVLINSSFMRNSITSTT